MDVTISLFRACVGGYVGGGHVHPALLDAAREGLAAAKESGKVADGFLTRCGDDIDLVVLQLGGRGQGEARSVAKDVFGQAASAGARLRQHGCNGGVSLDDVALSFVPRSSEPVLCFFSNRAPSEAFNLLAYRLFADPFNTAGLVSDPAMCSGFRFETRAETFDLPSDIYRLLGALRDGAAVTRVVSIGTGEVAAVVSAGSDPMMAVRSERPFPSVEDALDAFSTDGNGFGSSTLVPVSANGDSSARSMPRVMGLGFQVTPERLVGPRDLLGDTAFDDLRRHAVAAVRSERSTAFLRARDRV